MVAVVASARDTFNMENDETTTNEVMNLVNIYYPPNVLPTTIEYESDDAMDDSEWLCFYYVMIMSN